MNSGREGKEKRESEGAGRRLTVGIEELEWGTRKYFEAIEEAEG